MLQLANLSWPPRFILANLSNQDPDRCGKTFLIFPANWSSSLLLWNPEGSV